MMQKTFVHLFESGKSYAEIAEVMKITEGSINGRVERYQRRILITEDSLRIRNNNIKLKGGPQGSGDGTNY